MMVASITDRFAAVTVTAPVARKSLFEAWASTPPTMMFSAQAPAPLTAMPTEPPMPIATEAAKATASIFASSLAVTEIAPARASTTSACSMADRTSLSMVLRARARPMETATPTVPKAAATDAAPAKEWMLELSSARSVTLSALTVIVPRPLPSMTAATSTPTRFSANTPAPLAATPTVPPTATATEPANTSDSMRWSASEISSSAPAALTGVSIS